MARFKFTKAPTIFYEVMVRLRTTTAKVPTSSMVWAEFKQLNPKRGEWTVDYVKPYGFEQAKPKKTKKGKK